MPATRVNVNIPGEIAYDVRIGEDLLHGLGQWCRRVEKISHCPQLLMLSDSNVAPLYGSSVRNAFTAAGYRVSDITVPAGETAKSLSVASEVWEAMAELGLGRDAAVVALGGGVVGDLGGFIAATYMRGIPVVQVPTTLLSMVDSSVGGKTGLNLTAGKNLVGAFLQPSYVCASLDTLTTLPEREWACGCGEIAKSAVIDSDEFFFWLMDHGDDLRKKDMACVADAVSRSVVFKANVVAEDKMESRGVRECLNYGHTLAHAIESLAGYGTYSHGAAVAEGMRFAAHLGQSILGTSEEFVEAQGDLLDSLGLPPLGWREDPQRILASMKHDKKVRDGQLRFVLVRDVADWELADVADDVVLAALEEYI